MFEDNSKEIKINLFSEIKKEWANINWSYIESLSTNMPSLPAIIDETTFKHVFPSLLKHMEVHDTLLTNVFISNILDTKHISKEWLFEYYFSFPSDLNRLIAIMIKNKMKDSVDAEHALVGYWISFLNGDDLADL